MSSNMRADIKAESDELLARNKSVSGPSSSETKPPIKLIKVNNGSVRVSQACDRCRIKKIKCDGAVPCNNCSKIGFNCKTSDKLTRRAFPKGYTENLENRVKELEVENGRLMKTIENSTTYTAVSNDSEIKRERALEIQRHGSVPNEANISGSGLSPFNQASKSNELLTTDSSSYEPIDQIFNLDSNGLIIGNDNLNFESQFNILLESFNLPSLKLSNSHNSMDLTEESVDDHSHLYRRTLLNIDELFTRILCNLPSKSELDAQISNFFNFYNCLTPILDQESFMKRYLEFSAEFQLFFTGKGPIASSDITNQQIDEYFNFSIQLYAISRIVDPCLTLNRLNDSHKREEPEFKLYELLPYLNFLPTTITIIQTHLLSLYYSLIINHKVMSLKLTSSVNSLIGVMGINLNFNNLFFNDSKLPSVETILRVKLYWSFKILLKIFNLKFGFKPSINTTVINPVTIERYFELTPPTLTSLNAQNGGQLKLKSSIEFSNLLHIIIPSSFSPKYYNNLGAAYYDDDGNLNHNFPQFQEIDNDLNTWRKNLKGDSVKENEILYHNIPIGESIDTLKHQLSHVNSELTLVKIELNFNYLIIRCINYLNFFINRELSSNFYVKLSQLTRESLAYFLVIFGAVGKTNAMNEEDQQSSKRRKLSVSETKNFDTSTIINNLGLGQINLKKSIILQMIYLLICSLKMFKKNGLLINDSKKILNESISLFVDVFLDPTVFHDLSDYDESEDDYEGYTEDEKLFQILKFIKYKIDHLENDVFSGYKLNDSSIDSTNNNSRSNSDADSNTSTPLQKQHSLSNFNNFHFGGSLNEIGLANYESSGSLMRIPSNLNFLLTEDIDPKSRDHSDNSMLLSSSDDAKSSSDTPVSDLSDGLDTKRSDSLSYNSTREGVYAGLKYDSLFSNHNSF